MLKERAVKLKRDLPAVFFALKDSKTPLLAKLLAGLTVLYAFSPIDFIPDAIPVLGLVDDILLLPLLITLTIKLIPKEVWQRSQEKASRMDLKVKVRWYYVLPVLILWAILAVLVYLWIRG